uniref:Membrane-associated progesterone receptor component 1 n=1 Tax=Colletotrichum fructicola (strain Nara gc5) TaxID=1213859 RepID=L2G4U7_COLFN
MDYTSQRLQEEAVKLQTASSDAFFTPLNIILLLVLGYTIYSMLAPTPPPILPKEPPATVFFNPRTLLPFNGEEGKPIYFADMLTENLDGPLDTLEGLGPDEVEALQGWEEQFDSKYLVIGRLVAVGEEPEEDK